MGDQGMMSRFFKMSQDMVFAAVKQTDHVVKKFTGEDDYSLSDVTKAAASWVIGVKRAYPRLSYSDSSFIDSKYSRVRDIQNICLWSASLPLESHASSLPSYTFVARGSTVVGAIHLGASTFRFIRGSSANPTSESTAAVLPDQDSSEHESCSASVDSSYSISCDSTRESSPTRDCNTADHTPVITGVEPAAVSTAMPAENGGESADIALPHVNGNVSNGYSNAADDVGSVAAAPSDDFAQSEMFLGAEADAPCALNGTKIHTHGVRGDVLFEIPYSFIRDVEMPVHIKSSGPVQMRIVLKTFQVLSLHIDSGDNALLLFQTLAMRAFPGRRDALPALNTRATSPFSDESRSMSSTSTASTARASEDGSVDSPDVQAKPEAHPLDEGVSVADARDASPTDPACAQPLSVQAPEQTPPAPTPPATDVLPATVERDASAQNTDPSAMHAPAPAGVGCIGAANSDVPVVDSLSLAAKDTVPTREVGTDGVGLRASSCLDSADVHAQAAQESLSWTAFDLCAEYTRMGITGDWRCSDINTDYGLCNTYPRHLFVPAGISDEHLRCAAAYRSQGRLPVLSYYARRCGTVLLRSAQPLAGPMNRRNWYDEVLLVTACQTKHDESKPFHIFDARPKINAIANRASGKGYEAPGNYGASCRVSFLDIANIHGMRKSIEGVMAAASTASAILPWLRGRGNGDVVVYGAEFTAAIERTQWLHHVRQVLSGALRIVHTMVQKQHSVLVHCSDGWDRTAQLAALVQLTMDPFFRTIDGFRVLVQKEWLAFGHKFEDRLASVHHSNELSPVFTQFLDCVWQLMNQHPTEFEFSDRFLIDLHTGVHSGFFGNFLCNSDKERYHDERLHEYFGIVMCAFLDNKSIPATKNVVEFDRWSLTAVVVPRCYPTQQRTPCLWKHLTTNARDGDYRNAQYIARTSTSTTDVLSIDTSVEQILFFADLYIPSDMPRPYY